MTGGDGERLKRLAARVRDVPDFPKPGIVFKDITPLLADAAAFGQAMQLMTAAVRDLEIDLVAGPEARGFLFGAPMALALGVGFVPVRKRGKLPWKTREAVYALEYGEDAVQVHADAFPKGARVLLVDDLLATGGTMAACRRLVEEAGARVVGAAFLIELDFLSGRTHLEGLAVRSLLHY